MNPIDQGLRRWRALPASARSLIKLLLPVVLVLTYVAWAYTRMPGAILYVHNHTDRPIFSYAVNEAWGGNAFAYGGGKATCCSRIEGDVLTVQWIKSTTQAQYEAGLREETLTLQVPNPPRTRQDKYLHVHFFPGDQVRLFWSHNLDSPYENLKEAPKEGSTP
ncbi:DUF3304 domain-containing protein [Ectopseudomonas hydrolytica]|jgi:hypothetical protein|uniref:DUF3304 domain-containing protein n=1 Tax=Ectopseudomonas hydrolytica TaxID=2493633 RepID=UPI0018A73D85|nr:DUF3304 domain-containing protein [Pseudomonas hydrolytica]MBF8159716.1 DUF3304 domain-containing protein [Pseudomonas mendocina]UTH32516.1 DUF3304 domain-containing protein [Pseudomonas hydrolytica]UZZ11706.1 DUF3304 domain-containing protein [Pseudomonas mendocina]